MSSDEKTDLLRDASSALSAVEHDLDNCGRLPPETVALVRYMAARLQKEIEAAKGGAEPDK